MPLHSLLARRGNDGALQLTMGRQTATITHQVHPRQQHERRQLLQELQRRECDPSGAVGPRLGEGVDKIAVCFFREALKRHGASGGIAQQAFQLISALRWDVGMRMERKPMRKRSRGLSRHQPASTRWYKAQRKLARFHQRIHDVRADRAHKMTTEIVRTYRVVGMEDLNIKGMGKNRRLALSIADTSMGEIVRQLTYKAD